MRAPNSIFVRTTPRAYVSTFERSSPFEKSSGAINCGVPLTNPEKGNPICPLLNGVANPKSIIFTATKSFVRQMFHGFKSR